MEMCYDGALVMPKNCSVVSENEMTYIEGGWFYTSSSYYSDASQCYKNLNSAARTCYRCAVGVALTGTALGALVGAGSGLAGACFGAIIGGVCGLIAGSIMWSFGNAFDNGAIQAKYLGHRSCRVRFALNNFTLNISVY